MIGVKTLNISRVIIFLRLDQEVRFGLHLLPDEYRRHSIGFLMYAVGGFEWMARHAPIVVTHPGKCQEHGREQGQANALKFYPERRLGIFKKPPQKSQRHRD